jgi:hypothetical protein
VGTTHANLRNQVLANAILSPLAPLQAPLGASVSSGQRGRHRINAGGSTISAGVPLAFGSQEETVAGRAFKLCDPPHGFFDCLEARNEAPLSCFVGHV